MSEQPAAKVITMGGNVDQNIIRQILDGDPVRFILDDGEVIIVKGVNHCRGFGDEAVFSVQVRDSDRTGKRVFANRIVEVHLAG